MMQKIEDFVYDPTQDKQMVFNIGSYSLKKALSKEVTKVYMNTGIFTEFQRSISETVIKKSKQFNQNAFLRGFATPKDIANKTVKIANLGFCDQNALKKEAKAVKFKKQPEEEKVEGIETILPPLALTTQRSFGFYQDGGLEDPIAKLTVDLRAEAKQLYVRELGFSLIVGYLKENRKPLIGHNMIFDLGFLFHQFI